MEIRIDKKEILNDIYLTSKKIEQVVNDIEY